MRSGTNADLAREHAIVIIIAPIGSPTQNIGALARRQIEAEVASLRETGSIVDILLPDTAALTAFGPNLMDATRRAIVVEAGIQQGRAEALRTEMESELEEVRRSFRAEIVRYEAPGMALVPVRRSSRRR